MIYINRYAVAVFSIAVVLCAGQDDGKLEFEEENFKDLECSYQGSAGLCWPKSDCSKQVDDDDNSPCDREDLSDAICCPIEDKPTNPDPADRSIIGNPSITRFVNSHQPKNSYWTWKRMRGQQPGPVWRPKGSVVRPTLPPPRTTLPPTQPPAQTADRLVQPNECAKVVIPVISPLIVNGEETTVADFPFIAAFMSREFNDVFCGGTLISPSWVLTASHCVDRRTVGEFYIRFRDTNLVDRSDGTPVDIAPERITLHPKYTRATVYNDIALIKLSRPVTDEGVVPACLPDPALRSIDGSPVTVIGYGSDSVQNESTRRLLKAVIKVATADDCKEAYENSNRLPKGIDPTLICAGDVVKGKDACRGDSGGPLVLGDQGTWTLVGVVAAGRDCGKFNGLYTRVTSYHDWILQNAKD